MWAWGHGSKGRRRRADHEQRTDLRLEREKERERRRERWRSGRHSIGVAFGVGEEEPQAPETCGELTSHLWFLELAGFRTCVARMTRGKQKIEAQKRAAERNEKPKGSQIEARSAGLKTICTVCKAPLANYKQLVDHFGSKHPKEAVPPAPSS